MSTLKAWGFDLNPYNACVANKTINELQATIVWHIDNLKISHKDPAIVTDILQHLTKRFGTDRLLIISQGKAHKYLGMTIDYGQKGCVKLNMKYYIAAMLDKVPDTMKGTVCTPCSKPPL